MPTRRLAGNSARSRALAGWRALAAGYRFWDRRECRQPAIARYAATGRLPLRRRAVRDHSPFISASYCHCTHCQRTHRHRLLGQRPRAQEGFACSRARSSCARSSPRRACPSCSAATAARRCSAVSRLPIERSRCAWERWTTILAYGRSHGSSSSRPQPGSRFPRTGSCAIRAPRGSSERSRARSQSSECSSPQRSRQPSRTPSSSSRSSTFASTSTVPRRRRPDRGARGTARPCR